MRKGSKKIVVSAVLAFAVLLAALPLRGSSAGMVCFTVTNDSLLPLSDSTMPTYFGSVLYVPYAVFSNVKVYNTRSDGLVCLYKGAKRVDFYFTRGYVSDQDGRVYDNVRTMAAGGTIYVPLDFVCSYFGLQYSLIPADPASILRIKNSDALLTDRALSTWLTAYQLRITYNDYISGSGAAANPGSGENPGDMPDVPPPPTYEDVTLFPYIYNLYDENVPDIVGNLTYFGYKLSFFATASDILNNPELLRRIAGGGHTVGILLTEGSYGEYAEAAELLFKTTKQRTLFVLAAAGAEAAARETAAKAGLIFCGAADPEYTFKFDPEKPGESLPETHGARAALPLPCSADTAELLPRLLSYLQESRYTVAGVTETNQPDQ